MLDKCFDCMLTTTLVSQVEKTLTTEQRRSDYLPPKGAASVDRPTDACLLVSSLLRRAVSSTSSAMAGANARSVHAEIGRRLVGMLKAHMQTFVFGSRGALRWRRDLTEYADALQAGGVREVDEAMEELQVRAGRGRVGGGVEEACLQQQWVQHFKTQLAAPASTNVLPIC